MNFAILGVICLRFKVSVCKIKDTATRLETVFLEIWYEDCNLIDRHMYNFQSMLKKFILAVYYYIGQKLLVNNCIIQFSITIASL